MSLVSAAERGILPDPLIRLGIRRLIRRRLSQVVWPDCETEQAAREAFVDALRSSPVALHTQEANDQHYELPPEFFQLVLGSHLKYSIGEWSPTCPDLDGAEAAMLATTAARAELGAGQRVRRGSPANIAAHFALCEGGFAEHYLGDVQMLLERPRGRRAPLLGAIGAAGDGARHRDEPTESSVLSTSCHGQS